MLMFLLPIPLIPYQNLTKNDSKNSWVERSEEEVVLVRVVLRQDIDQHRVFVVEKRRRIRHCPALMRQSKRTDSKVSFLERKGFLFNEPAPLRRLTRSLDLTSHPKDGLVNSEHNPVTMVTSPLLSYDVSTRSFFGRIVVSV